jgi:hypothetical protein
MRLLLLKRVHQSLHSNGRGADNNEPIIALLPINEQQTLILQCCVPFEVSMASTVTAWGKHATILNRNVSNLIRHYNPEDCILHRKRKYFFNVGRKAAEKGVNWKKKIK